MSVQLQLAEVRYLGIDELYLHNQYRCVITDVGNRHIVDLLRDRHKATIIDYLQSLPDATELPCPILGES